MSPSTAATIAVPLTEEIYSTLVMWDGERITGLPKANVDAWVAAGRPAPEKPADTVELSHGEIFTWDTQRKGWVGVGARFWNISEFAHALTDLFIERNGRPPGEGK